MDELFVEQPNVNFVPCVCWVRKGVAKSNPDKLQLTPNQLADIIGRTQKQLKIEEESDEDNEDKVIEKLERQHLEDDDGVDVKSKSESDEYDFAHYDDEEGANNILSLGNVTVLPSTSDDPYASIREDDDDNDSDKEDEIIKPDDNLILVGHVEGDASILEVYVYNEEEGSLYVHHDIYLPSYPLCIEWLSRDPILGVDDGNLCAIGNMSRTIEIWDVDLVNSLEPVMKLGRKVGRKKYSGHKNAVLDLSWNVHFPHLLASGSVDQSVIIWDLDNGTVGQRYKEFKGKVQTLKWHPFEGQTLVTGCCDGSASVFDCRTEDSCKKWKIGGEIERVVWDTFNPFCFFASSDNGIVSYVDCRSNKPLWCQQAHDEAVTGMALSSMCPGMLVTASADGCLRIWDIKNGGKNNGPEFISEKKIGVGTIHCLQACPDLPFVYASGGDKKDHNFGVWHLMYNDPAVEARFTSRELVVPEVLSSSEDKREQKKQRNADSTEENGNSESLNTEENIRHKKMELGEASGRHKGAIKKVFGVQDKTISRHNRKKNSKKFSGKLGKNKNNSK